MFGLSRVFWADSALVLSLFRCWVQVQMIAVDAALGPVTVMFSGAREPIAAAGATAVFGRLAVARQVTAPPALYTRQLPVGRLRSVEIAVSTLP